MKCKIMHESEGRIRVHMKQSYMTSAQADLLEYYLREIPGVTRVKVSERTADATVNYRGDVREKIIKGFAEFDYETSRANVPDHTGRELQRYYHNKICFHLIRRILTKLFLPMPLRMLLTIADALPRILEGIKSLKNGKLEVSVLDATSITVSMLRRDFNTASSIIFMLKLGDIIEEWTHKKSVDDLASAMSLNVDKVWVKTGEGQELLTDIKHVEMDDLIVVRTGNMIPLDGIVYEGEALVNQASITGEPLPVKKSVDTYIYAGSVIEEGELTVQVKKLLGSGHYDRIVKMIEESEKLKSTTEAKASRLADNLVPWTFGATLLTYLLTRNVTRAVSILNVDFCCALKLAMPVTILSAMREAGEHHISVKGGKFIEAFAEAETIVFDKTGTLTNATPQVKSIISFSGQDEKEMLRLAACLEEHYPHSIANAVVKASSDRGLDHEEKHSTVEYIVAHGIASSVEDSRVLIGSYHFIFEDEKCRVPEDERKKFDELPDEYSHLYLAIDGTLAAVILIEDPLKEEAASAIKHLHELGFKKIVMMTGDSERTAKAVAKAVGIDEYYSEVLPEDKGNFIRSEHEAGRKVVMIGDGINDSPALSEADVGIAINSGAAIAREIADITISEDNLESLVVLRVLSKSLMLRINRNYRSIIGFNSFLILMGMFGIFAPTMTALLHNASTLAIGMHGMTNMLREEDEAVLISNGIKYENRSEKNVEDDC